MIAAHVVVLNRRHELLEELDLRPDLYAIATE